MPRAQRRRSATDNNYWIGYTDLLSNSLLLLLLTVAVTAIAKASREKPPLIQLTEEQSFRFKTGSYTLSPSFIKSLDRRMPEIRDTISKFRIDSIEVIGHTDGQHSSGRSNLDLLLPAARRTPVLGGYRAGSNADLGLLRAMSVANYLRVKLDSERDKYLVIRPYSAGSLIASDGRYDPADIGARADRRRVEIRFTRKSEN